MLTVVDDYTGGVLASAVDYSLPNDRAIAALERAAGPRILPARPVSDSGFDLSSRVILTWAHTRSVALDFASLDKPVIDSHLKIVNGKLWNECLRNQFFRPRRRVADDVGAGGGTTITRARIAVSTGVRALKPPRASPQSQRCACSYRYEHAAA